MNILIFVNINPDEFFAVATETFFEKPQALKYSLLANMALASSFVNAGVLFFFAQMLDLDTGEHFLVRGAHLIILR